MDILKVILHSQTDIK